MGRPLVVAQHARVMLILLIGMGLALAVTRPSTSATAPPDVLYVAPGADCGSGTAILDCYADVQSAVDDAPPGAEVRVASGVYTHTNDHGGSIQALYISKTLTVRGGYTVTNWSEPDPHGKPTILNAQAQGRVIFITGNITPTIEGLHITQGNIARLGRSDVARPGFLEGSARDPLGVFWGPPSLTRNTLATDTGGGVCVNAAHAILKHNRIYDNVARYGGGIYLLDSSSTISENVVISNTATLRGGGLHLVQSDARLYGNTIINNTSYRDGGGAYLENSSGALLTGNVFARNTARLGAGGGLELNSSAAELNGNSILDNSAHDYGGGVALIYYSDATLTNNVIANNDVGVIGSGVYVAGASPTLLHNTIANNGGENASGVYVEEEEIWWDWVVYSSVALTNTILSDQETGIYVASGNTATLTSTLWHNNTSNWAGSGTIEHGGDVAGDPIFVSPTRGDYHVGASSAARDAGVDAGIATDIDGEARPKDLGHDIGADEYARSSCAFLPGDTCAFYGDLHSHTGYSDGVAGSTPQQAYETARSNGLDFFGTSDHGFLLNEVEWENTLIQARAATEEGYFVALHGFEWSSDDGHINVFGTDSFISACDPDYNELQEGYTWLSAPEQSNGVAQFNHPTTASSPPCGQSRYGARVEPFYHPATTAPDPFNDLAHDPLADSRISLIEIGNGIRSYEDKYRQALSSRWRVAPTNNSDTHIDNWGQRRARTGIIAPSLNYDEVLDALRTGRVFSTQDENLVLAMQADGHWMGAHIPGERTRFDVYVFDPSPNDLVDTLELYRNGKLFASTAVNAGEFVWSYTLTSSLAGENWWYARAIQSDGDHATTGPLWTRERSCWARLNDDPTDYVTVQDAVDASTHPTDVVKVAGHCFGPPAPSRQVVTISKTLTVRGGYTVTNWSESDPLGNPTLLDARGERRVVLITGNHTPTIVGLHNPGGNAAGPLQGTIAIGHGGGVYVDTAQAILRNNWIYDNIAAYGGGVELMHSDATVSGNVVRSNTAWRQGGGLYVEQSAAHILGNVVTANTSQGHGGGLSLYQHSDAILTNNVLANNQAVAAGGSVYVAGAFPTFLHNTIAGNGESGLYVQAITGTTVITYSSVALTNTILSGHETGIYVGSGNNARLESTLWHDNLSDWGGAGDVGHSRDLAGDPAFVSPANDDYHIGPASAARDAGIDAGVVVDVDGETRPNVLGYDVGADEFWTPVLIVVQEASPDPVQAGARLTYTIRITNVGAVDLHTTITDTLPPNVTLDENLAGTVPLPGNKLVWTPVLSTPGGAWTQQLVVTVPVQYGDGSAIIGYVGPLTNVVRVTSPEGASGMVTRTTMAHWARTLLYYPLSAQNFAHPRNALLNPGFEGIGVPVNNDQPNPGNWTRDTFNGVEYGEIFTPEGWVTWWEEGDHRRPEARVIPKEIPYTFDPIRIYQGYYAAMYFTMYGTQRAGYYQKVTDLPPGTPVTFYAHAHGWSCHRDEPLGYSCDDPENLGFRVGIDPGGGTDPWSPNILWSERTLSPDTYRRIGPVRATVGPGGNVTVFLRSDAKWPFKHNDAYWDNAALMVPIP